MDSSKTANGLQIILGMGNTGAPAPLTRFADVQSARAYLTAFAERGYRQLDTARNYPPDAPETSEALMGETFPTVEVDGKKVEFIVDTKLRYAPPQTHTAEKVEKSIRDSLEALKIGKIHVEYLHAIDETSDKKETCLAMEKTFKEGKFELFGLSNASAIQIGEFIVACEEQGLSIRPKVLQENYSVLVRDVEENGVMSKGRENGMSFYAFSPAGGGIFNTSDYRDRKGGRFHEDTRIGQSYREIFYNKTLLQIVKEVREACEQFGLEPHAMSLKWVIWHSNLSAKHGDGIILAASTVDQLKANLDAIESGPLPAELVEILEAGWAKLKGVKE